MRLVDLAKKTNLEATSYGDVLNDLREQMDVDHLACGTMIPCRQELFGYSTYSSEWLNEYGDRDYFYSDPVILVAQQSATPFDWSRLRDQDQYREFFIEAQKYGVPRNGMSIPIRGPKDAFSVFSISKRCTDSEWTRHISTRASSFMLVAAQMHDNIVTQAMGMPGVFETLPPKLGKNEIEILTLLSGGAHIDEIPNKLSISRRSVEILLRSARIKLDAVTNDHAISRAANIGAITKIS